MARFKDAILLSTMRSHMSSLFNVVTLIASRCDLSNHKCLHDCSHKTCTISKRGGETSLVASSPSTGETRPASLLREDDMLCRVGSLGRSRRESRHEAHIGARQVTQGQTSDPPPPQHLRPCSQGKESRRSADRDWFVPETASLAGTARLG